MKQLSFLTAPGRPRSPDVKSGALRTSEWRLRKAQEQDERRKRLAHLSDVTLARYVVHADTSDVSRDCWLELGRRLGFK